MDGRRLAEGALVLAVVLAGAAAYLKTDRAPAPAEPPVAAAPPQAEGPVPEMITEEAPRSSLTVQEPQELSFGRIMDILGAESGKPEVAPAAAEFRAAFMAEPELKKTYEDFKEKDARGERPAAADFLHALRELPPFRKLSAAWGSGRGKSAMLLLAKNPELRRFLHDERRSGPAASAGPVSGRGPVQGFGAVAQGRGAQSRQGSRGYSASGGNAAYASAGPGEIGAGGNAIGAGASGSTTLAGGGAGRSESGGALTPLGKAADACSQEMDHMLKEWLARYGLNAAAYLSDSGSGIWDLCFTRRELQRCDAACHNQPQTSASRTDTGCGAVGHTKLSAVCAPPSDPTYWGTCMEATGDELRCVRECNEQAPCKIDSGAWARHCGAHPRPECSANGGRGAPEGGGGCRGEGCTPEGIDCWAQGIGLPKCVGEQFCGERGHLPASLPELVDWGNATGRRNPADKRWTCR